MTHEQKPESAEFRTIRTITLSQDDYDRLVKHAEMSKAQMFCQREKEARDRTPQRDDVKQWQTDQKQFYLSSLIEVVTEYAEWRDRKDAEGAELVKWQRQNPGHGWIDTAEEDLPFYKECGFPVRTLYIRPANVAALEARVKELERVNKAWSGAVDNALTWLENSRKVEARVVLKSAYDVLQPSVRE